MIIAIVIGVILYLLFCAFNFGVLFAYFQRRIPEKADDKLSAHISVASVICVFGPLVIPSVTASTTFPMYGIKFWKGEIEYSDIYMLTRLSKDRNKFYEAYSRVLEHRYGSKSIAGGRCRDMWK